MAIARTPEEEQAVKDQLISICAKIFFRDGYSKVTMKSLSEEAGCTTGKFYSNFSGKPEILQILLGKLTRVNYDEASKLMDADDTAFMQLVYFFVLQYEVCHVNEKLCELFYYAYEDSDAIRSTAEQMKTELGRVLSASYNMKDSDEVLMSKSAMNFNILRSIISGEMLGYTFGDEKTQLATLLDTIMASCGVSGKNAEKVRNRVEEKYPLFREATFNMIIRILQTNLS
ncbi:MAG: TetR/AcrR family transcriptional regulator [Lachnospiraceae bacterium]|nr:TetR/AcrR family transcriptional regulator [Lachnospiraceae bacterium]